MLKIDANNRGLDRSPQHHRRRPCRLCVLTRSEPPPPPLRRRCRPDVGSRRPSELDVGGFSDFDLGMAPARGLTLFQAHDLQNRRPGAPATARSNSDHRLHPNSRFSRNRIDAGDHGARQIGEILIRALLLDANGCGRYSGEMAMPGRRAGDAASPSASPKATAARARRRAIATLAPAVWYDPRSATVTTDAAGRHRPRQQRHALEHPDAGIQPATR